MDDLFDVEEEDTVPPAPITADITPPTTPPTLHPTATTSSSIGTNSQRSEATNEGEVTRLVAIATEGDVPLLYLTTRACQDLYHICGTDGEKRAWMGVVTHEHVREMAGRTKSCEEEHLEETKNAFMRAGQADCHFEYVTQLEGNGDLTLTWKRILKDGVKVLLGTVVMETRPMADVNHGMLKDGAKETVRFVEEIERVKKENSRLAGERDHALMRLRETVNIKEEVEADLYGKFVLYANAKKAKIRSLAEALATLSASKDGATKSEKHTHRPTAAMESDEEYNTRESTPPKSPSPKPDPPAVPQESILLGDKQWLEEPVAPPTKRRKRQPNRPSKVIQKPSSVSSSNRYSRESRSKSTEVEMDSQELIENM